MENIVLHQPPRAWGTPNISPFCAKLETYLRMTEIPYSIGKFSRSKAPKGKVPFIEISGSYMNRVIQLSLNAQDPKLALDHECFHFAHANLLTTDERVLVEREFAAGSRLFRPFPGLMTILKGLLPQ